MATVTTQLPNDEYAEARGEWRDRYADLAQGTNRCAGLFEQARQPTRTWNSHARVSSTEYRVSPG
jgi:hypothetical protein